jgi:hypothetical protein
MMRSSFMRVSPSLLRFCFVRAVQACALRLVEPAPSTSVTDQAHQNSHADRHGQHDKRPALRLLGKPLQRLAAQLGRRGTDPRCLLAYCATIAAKPRGDAGQRGSDGV